MSVGDTGLLVEDLAALKLAKRVVLYRASSAERTLRVVQLPEQYVSRLYKL